MIPKEENLLEQDINVKLQKIKLRHDIGHVKCGLQKKVGDILNND